MTDAGPERLQNPMQIKIEKLADNQTLNAESIAELYQSAGWGMAGDYRSHDIERMFRQTTCVRFARDASGQIRGWVRALSDGISITWIAEVVVAPEYRGQGIGRALIAAVLRDYGHTAIYAEVFAGAEGFLHKCGLTPQPRLIACSRAPIKNP